MGLENRLQKRVPVSCDVLINRSIKVKGLDLSEGGIYVHTGRLFKPGTTLEVMLDLKGKLLTLKAVVQHAQEGVGMGLKFIDIKPEQREDIVAFMEESASLKALPSKKKILLVDDTDTTRRMNKSKLVLEGYTVIEAKDGLEAIEAMNKESFDLIVLDLYMERMDGFKVLSLMRQNPQLENIPVVVLSARSGTADVDRAMAAGASTFLPKMMTSPAKLAEKIKEILKS